VLVGGSLGVGAIAIAVLSVVFGYVFMLAGMALSHAATVKAVAALHLGRDTSVVGAYKALRGRIWSLFGALSLIGGSLVVVIIVAVLVPTLAFVGRAGSNMAGPIVRVLVMAALVLTAFVAIYVRYALAIQACVVEGISPRASLKRSVFLSPRRPVASGGDLSGLCAASRDPGGGTGRTPRLCRDFAA
jgi:hypothetical protein